MDASFFKGIIPPIATPIDENENVNENKLREHIDFMIDRGVSGILAFGSNSEFYMMDKAEQKEVLSIILDQVNGRVPVYMGVGMIRTKACIDLALMGKEMGVSAVSVLQPMFLKPTEDTFPQLHPHSEILPCCFITIREEPAIRFLRTLLSVLLMRMRTL